MTATADQSTDTTDKLLTVTVTKTEDTTAQADITTEDTTLIKNVTTTTAAHTTEPAEDTAQADATTVDLDYASPTGDKLYRHHY